MNRSVRLPFVAVVIFVGLFGPTLHKSRAQDAAATGDSLGAAPGAVCDPRRQAP